MKYYDLPKEVFSIEDIETIVQQNNIPMRETCRFFIDEDYREPKAFGVYYDGQEWIVYKNKANGERVIRYHGYSERFAAQTIWDKFLEEFSARTVRQTNFSDRGYVPENRSAIPVAMVCASFAAIGAAISKAEQGSWRLPILIMATVFAALLALSRKRRVNTPLMVFGAFFLGMVMLIVVSLRDSKVYYHDGGYYNDPSGHYYYRQGNDWYSYDDNGYWDPYFDSYDDFYVTEPFTGNNRFEDSDLYDRDNAHYYSDPFSDSHSSDWDDWDSDDDDWDDWDDWDSDDTDWDSDW